jgi:hypothetical protein
VICNRLMERCFSIAFGKRCVYLLSYTELRLKKWSLVLSSVIRVMNMIPTFTTSPGARFDIAVLVTLNVPIKQVKSRERTLSLAKEACIVSARFCRTGA